MAILARATFRRPQGTRRSTNLASLTGANNVAAQRNQSTAYLTGANNARNVRQSDYGVRPQGVGGRRPPINSTVQTPSAQGPSGSLGASFGGRPGRRDRTGIGGGAVSNVRNPNLPPLRDDALGGAHRKIRQITGGPMYEPPLIDTGNTSVGYGYGYGGNYTRRRGGGGGGRGGGTTTGFNDSAYANLLNWRVATG